MLTEITRQDCLPQNHSILVRGYCICKFICPTSVAAKVSSTVGRQTNQLFSRIAGDHISVLCTMTQNPAFLFVRESNHLKVL